MSLGGGQTQTPVAGSNKYAEIMELMRRRNAMNNSTYTGGFNPYAVAAPSSGSSSAYDELLRLQALNNSSRGGGRDEGGPSGDGYSPNVSPMSNSINGSFGYQLADTYGNLFGGMLPGGFLAQALAQSMNPSQVANAGVQSAQALQDAIAGYTSGTMFGTGNTGAASTFGGGGYGTPTSEGGYGVTGMTGAGVAANPMGIDPATAQGQQAAAPATSIDVGYNAGVQAREAENSGGFYGREGGGGGGGGGVSDGGGRESGGNFGGDSYGGSYGFNKGGKVTMNRLRGPNPMGPDDGYGGLDDGEFVINAKSVGKYGIELMNAINNGKISKGKLRGLLEA